MKEFESCKTNVQVIFNSMLCLVGNPIECFLGRLKGRWGILTKRTDFNQESVLKIVVTGFVLLNFCESRKNNIDEDLVCAH